MSIFGKCPADSYIRQFENPCLKNYQICLYFLSLWWGGGNRGAGFQGEKGRSQQSSVSTLAAL